MTDVYEVARAYAAEAERQAKEQVWGLKVETLQAEYVSLTAMVAYYTKIEREMARPRFHMDAIRKLLVQIKAEEILQQAELADEQGVEISGDARVPAKPFLALLERLQEIANPESDQ